MKFEDVERQSFENFGEIEVFNPDVAQEIEIANDHEHEDAENIDVIANDIIADDAADVVEPLAPAPIKTGFSWTAFAGGLAALAWIGGAIGGPLSYYGLNAVLNMDPAMQAGILALAFGPAILFWLSSSAAGEALKARRIATELTRIAYQGRTLVPANDTNTDNISLKVSTEIEALNDAVAAALNRLADLEDAAQRNTKMFDNAIAATRENTAYMAGHLARERDALMELNADMRGQTETMSQSIGRQIRLMREASKLVKTEISAAEDALESHLTSFAAQAGVMADRTNAFHQVADTATDATSSLNGTLHQMLDGLGEATRLTDAARQSSEQAVLAANETANAVRETTRNAVFEAKRAAQLIRAETVALQDAAAETLSTLQAAAEAARLASEESQAAADRHSAQIEKRLSALASTAAAPRKATPAPAPVAAPAPRPVEVKYEEPTNVHAAATAARAAAAAVVSTPRPQARVETLTVEPRHAKGGQGLRGLGGWGNFMPQTREVEAKQAPVADAFDLVDFGEPKNPDVALKNDAIDLVSKSGVDLSDVLQPADLERIASASRNGAIARRRAVNDAAPAAVGRIARHLRKNRDARLAANEFRARPDLAKSDSKAESRDLTRAYLLIDAALA